MVDQAVLRRVVLRLQRPEQGLLGAENLDRRRLRGNQPVSWVILRV